MIDHATMCGFADSEAPLRSRILAMTTPPRAVSIAAILSAAVLGVVLLVGVLKIPVPAVRLQVEIGQAPPAPEEAAITPIPPRPSSAQQDHHAVTRPVFTPVSIRPELINREQVASALLAAYPIGLRDNGIGGTATVWLRVGPDGLVQNVRVHESSGYEALDEVAAGVADIMRFQPALNRDQRVPVWVDQRVTFVPGAPNAGLADHHAVR